MILKTFYVVRKREKIIQYEAGPFVTSLAAEDYIRQKINAQMANLYAVARHEIEVDVEEKEINVQLRNRGTYSGNDL